MRILLLVASIALAVYSFHRLYCQLGAPGDLQIFFRKLLRRPRPRGSGRDENNSSGWTLEDWAHRARRGAVCAAVIRRRDWFSQLLL